VIGVDREAAMLDAARQRTVGCDNVTLVQGPLEALPLADTCLDVALCMLVLHHVPEPELALVEAARVLRSGGHLVLLDMDAHTREEYRRTMGHQHLGFSRSTLQALADRAGLTVLTWRLLPADPAAQGPALFLAVLRA
jgi:ArsR family transcriptional regulator